MTTSAELTRTASPDTPTFTLHLPAFEGPLDLLLTLISKHRLDVTEIALAAVTDEFLAHTRQLDRYDLGQTTEFLVIASTLLDLKIARLLPSRSAPADEDLALLEARDLLFARLLQYRAYKQAAALLGRLLSEAARTYWRDAPLEPWLAAALPEVEITMSPTEFGELAARVLTPAPVELVATAHVHAPPVSVPDHMARILHELARFPARAGTFRELAASCASLLDVVATFLALLELFRAGRVSFEQQEPLDDLGVRLLPHADDGENPVP